MVSIHSCTECINAVRRLCIDIGFRDFSSESVWIKIVMYATMVSPKMD